MDDSALEKKIENIIERLNKMEESLKSSSLSELIEEQKDYYDCVIEETEHKFKSLSSDFEAKFNYLSKNLNENVDHLSKITKQDLAQIKDRLDAIEKKQNINTWKWGIAVFLIAIIFPMLVILIWIDWF